eukprot:c18945_g1_i1 orf=390-1280(-)
MASSLMQHKSVCVTGASGFIGSWLVHFLLQRGYCVRGTVQNLGDEAETKHLLGLEGAHTRLELFEADLLNYESLASAIGKSEGVFHVASPCFLQRPKDPQKELIDPAVQGTLNVLKAAHAAGVRRVVVTSSCSAMFPNPRLPPGTVIDENSWTDIDFCKEREGWYPISKVLSEKAAWKFAEETGLDVVVINPGCVLGPLLQPRLNASSGVLSNLMQDAKGRYLCTEGIIHFSDLAEEVAQMYPMYNVYRFKEETHPGLVRVAKPSRKLESLGFTFTSREEAIKSSVASLQDKGFLS